MGLLSKIGGMLLIMGAALAGNWVGDNLRGVTSGEPSHRLSLIHQSSEGHTVIGLNVALTNFVPALLLALLAGKPRTLYAFVSGAIISALVGNGYERALADWLRGMTSSGLPFASAQGSNWDDGARRPTTAL